MAEPVERTTPKDIFLSEVKTRDVFPLLVLHIVREEPAYGNAIMAQIRDLCGDHERLAEHDLPSAQAAGGEGVRSGGVGAADTRSRRFYKITRRGEEKYAEIKGRFEVHLLRVREAIESLHRELYG